MNSKGAVVCFQKFGSNGSVNSLLPERQLGHICLGYFDRMVVHKVESFKEYMRITSKSEAESQCSRKQLLLYQIEKKYDDDIIIKDDGNKIAFKPNPEKSDDTCNLCCCTVLNLNNELRKKSIKNVVYKLWESLISLNMHDIHFAITGVLGAEDLCVIFLSNSFKKIAECIECIQTCKLDDTCFAVDNTHSILALNTNYQDSINIEWGQNTLSDIHFTLKTVAGNKYIQDLVSILKGLYPLDSENINVYSWLGEYDVVLRCPAHCISSLFCDDGGLDYSNNDYCKAIYQSETVVYPLEKMKVESIHSSVIKEKDSLETLIEMTVREIKENILGADNSDKGDDLIYIELALYRLLKEYNYALSNSYDNEINTDLTIQFRTAIHAIRIMSQGINKKNDKYSSEELIKTFIGEFNRIANTLSFAMQAIGQFEKFNFDEQPSYLLNIGAYYKILRCFYGIIKQVVQLIYSVKRKDSKTQNVLIPILSFGQTSIIVSKRYSSFYTDEITQKEKKAQLICIQLPYQALCNPPKYLGIIVHEMFHYSAPSNRETRNMFFSSCLINVALGEFVSNLATGVPEGRNYTTTLRKDFDELLEKTSYQLTQDLFELNPLLKNTLSDELKDRLFQILNFERDFQKESYKYYFSCWKNMRTMLINSNKKAQFDTVMKYIFSLDYFELSKEQLYEQFSQKVKNVISFESLHLLLELFSKSFMEIAPDIFDLGVVLYKEPMEKWAQQFFWQMTSIRGDLQLGMYANLNKENAINESIANFLDSNAIRSGAIISYFIPQIKVDEKYIELRNTYLSQWCGKDNFVYAQEKFYNEIKLYLDIFKGSISETMNALCHDIYLSYAQLSQNVECQKIMKKFSIYYECYCDGLEKYNKNNVIKGAKRLLNKHMFSLCIALVEDFQEQKSLYDLCKIAFKMEDSFFQKQDCKKYNYSKFIPQTEYLIEHPADFARAIRIAYLSMRINNEIPMLWYRGHRIHTWPSLPNIMRGNIEANCFYDLLQEEVRLARSKILPFGQEFCYAEWLAYLQHHEFKTNILDFSEEFYPAMYFAIEGWQNSPKEPEDNACVKIFNPILFNLSMDALYREVASCDAEKKASKDNLTEYLRTGRLVNGTRAKLPLFASGEQISCYNPYFDFSNDVHSPYCSYPCAALVPKNSERMKKQSGQFVFYDLHTKRKEGSRKECPYEQWSLENLQKEYIDFAYRSFSDNDKNFIKPFLFKVEINKYYYDEFVKFIQLIGLCKHRVYPEHDKLAEDIRSLLFK